MTLVKANSPLTREDEMKRVIIVAAVAGMALVRCGIAESDCGAPVHAYKTCFARGFEVVQTTCEAEETSGICVRPRFWACYSDNECSDTNDTDTIAVLEACLADNAACE